jgi:DNA helicase-2/ATP-dependent DNA helicase PcrA
MSKAGIARVAELGRTLRAVREQSHLPLPELVHATERLLRLDVDVLARPGTDARPARRHLDAFADVAADFAAGSREPSLGAFLGWLEAAADRERGLDTTEVEVDPAAVQVLTVHAAKGLEWDVVAAVGLADGSFPSYEGPVRDSPASSAWLTALDALPYPLRRDAAQLPALDVDGSPDHAAMAHECADFRVRAGRHGLAEERRLAYVAVTRARRALVLAGSWWKEEAQQPRPPSRFLRELVRAGAVSAVVDTTGWDRPRTEENPLLAQPRSAMWPAEPPAEIADQARRSVAAVQAARERLRSGEPGTGGPRGARVTVTGGEGVAQVTTAAGTSPRAQAWLRDVRLLLAEQAQRPRQDTDHGFPAHLGASEVVRLVEDPSAFALDRRRPVPTAPTSAARRGTHFHAWVERHFGAATLLEVEDLPGVDDVDESSDADLAALKDAFLASPWAGRTPIGIEVSMETPVAGTTIRCRVDAVFQTEGGVQIVDWKTGPPPKTGAAAEARQLQLSLYRLAWSRLHGVPLESVQAAFYHVRQRLVVQAAPLTEDEILEAISGNPYWS